MTNLNDEITNLWKIIGTSKHGCLNIAVSEKLCELVKRGIISSFEIKNNTIYIHCEGHIAEQCDSYGIESN